MRRRLQNGTRSLVAFAAAALLLVPTAASASAAPSPAPAGTATALGAKRLDITMQAQQKSNWCWAAGGNTIATWFGRGYSQNQFCNAAFQRQQGYDCPNWQATLGNVQT
ncbi:papain-like cysteine protease family protein, partial [Streptomyces anthocyanicus]